MKARYNRNRDGSQGPTLSFCLVLPSQALRDLVYRHLRQQFPELNYCCEWKDTHGWGLHLTVSDWHQSKGSMYHVPPSRRAYEECPADGGKYRGRWDVADVRDVACLYGRNWRTMLLEFEGLEDNPPSERCEMPGAEFV